MVLKNIVIILIVLFTLISCEKKSKDLMNDSIVEVIKDDTVSELEEKNYDEMILIDILKEESLRIMILVRPTKTTYLGTLYGENSKYKASFESSGSIYRILGYSEESENIRILCYLENDSNQLFFDDYKLYYVDITKKMIVDYLKSHEVKNGRLRLEIEPSFISNGDLFSHIASYTNLVVKKASVVNSVFLLNTSKLLEPNNIETKANTQIFVIEEVQVEGNMFVKVITEDGFTGFLYLADIAYIE